MFFKTKHCSLFGARFLNVSYMNKKNIKKKLFNLNTNYDKLYHKFVGFLIKRGLKFKFKKLFDNSLFFLSNFLKMYPFRILNLVLKKLTSSIETRKVRVRRNFHLVPTPVTCTRRRYLCIK